MAKTVVRSRGKIYSINEETHYEKWDRRWLAKYQEFNEYVNKFGHQRIPCDDKSPRYTPEFVVLYRWANTQRIACRRGKLQDWRYNLLVKAGFLFEPIETYWNRNYNNLVKFFEKNGHCNVSRFDKNNLRLGKWIGEQRFHKNRLSPEKIKKMDDIGFDWGIKRNKWDDMYEWLKNYYIKNGEPYVKRDMSKGYSANELNRLNRWCTKQITRYNKGILSPDRIKLLKEINFDFNHLQSILNNFWQNNYEKLLEFKKRFGHFNVPVNWEEDKVLSRWVQRNRVYKNKLSQERLHKLEEIGFAWDYKDDVWEKNFLRLKEYAEQYGNCTVLQSYDSKLADWVTYMRKIRRGNYNYQLTSEQIRKLDGIGFDWNPSDTFWEKHYQMIVEFKKKHGHCKVKPSEETKTLYHWCSTNRNNKNKLSNERISKLDEIGFDWSPRDNFWEKHYQMIVEFKEKNGHCKVKLSEETKSLYNWCKTNRKRKNKLTAERISKLDAIGFIW